MTKPRALLASAVVAAVMLGGLTGCVKAESTTPVDRTGDPTKAIPPTTTPPATTTTEAPSSTLYYSD